jgi:Carboxypeptidase regulatory-like domain/TonB dependent receptor-like, beta-barrel
MKWLVAVLAACLFTSAAVAQSTFGSIVGTVKDQSGSVVPGATVTLVNAGSSATRTVTTGASGNYEFLNLDAGNYQVSVAASGFKDVVIDHLVLQARDTQRIDATMVVGSAAQTVEVQAAGDVITTETSSLASTKTGHELVDLPVAVYSRSNGSTSPILTLTTEPGVQVDDNSNLVIAGTTPALMSFTIDGISSVNVENSGPIAELFPSFNSISEIRVSESNNNAEYSGVADVTTTSRAGTNDFHGGVFENLENTALTAGNPFTGKPSLHMNDFGGFAGGPIRIPHVYNGRDKSFFFFSYEGLRLPREFPLVESFPSVDMRNGNLWNYLVAQGGGTPLPIANYDGTPIPCTGPSNCSVPVSPVAANVIQTLMPLPNAGASDAFQNNYSTNFPAPISSNQFDIRIDRNITDNQSIYGRFTWKNRSVTTAPTVNCDGFCDTSISPLLGGISQPEEDRGLTVAYNYTIHSNLMNEFRAGYNAIRDALDANVNSASLINQVGITGIPDIAAVPTVPDMEIVGLQRTGGLNTTKQQSKVIQLLDDLTWVRGKHTFKFGGDVRRLTDHDENVFGNYRAGQYVFNGTSDVGATIGDPYVQFLLGYPDNTTLSQVTNPAMNGLGYSYAAFAQDDWKITPYLTINAGLRYEVHPPLKDTHYNTAAFLPDYDENGIHGAVAVPNAQALTYTNPGFLSSIAPTPILTASQAGLPLKLRYTDRTDFGPRIGFAWRPNKDDKTVIRGGWGRFIESPLGFSLVSGWAVHASFVPLYSQDYGSDGAPLLSFPSPFPTPLDQPGTASFEYAFPIHYRDPTVQQWNATFERDLGHDIGMRLSYVGSHGSNLENFNDLNQVPANTGEAAPLVYPIWGIIQSVVNQGISNYNSYSALVEKRMSHGLQFQASYVLTRDLSDAGGAVPTEFAPAGGNWVSDKNNPRLDYGNVMFDRRHRFLGTGLYQLPFGRGSRFLGNSGRMMDAVVGGWQLGGVVVFQSGAFLTMGQASVDSANTGILNTLGVARADVVPGVSPRATKGLSNAAGPVFVNPAAFALPAADAGRFGTASVGDVVGPGTDAVSLSLIKSIKITEQLQFQFGAQAANAFNHRNYDVPNAYVDDPAFGTISGLQSAEGAGPRNVEITGRISF